LHLLCTLGGLPVAFALTGAKADSPGVFRASSTARSWRVFGAGDRFGMACRG
jgi:hypothetical protein